MSAKSESSFFSKVASSIKDWLADLLQNHWIPRRDYDERLALFQNAILRIAEQAQQIAKLSSDNEYKKRRIGELGNLTALLVDRGLHLRTTAIERPYHWAIQVDFSELPQVTGEIRSAFIRRLSDAIAYGIAGTHLLHDKDKSRKFLQDWRDTLSEMPAHRYTSIEATIEFKYRQLLECIEDEHRREGETLHKTAMRLIYTGMRLQDQRQHA